VLFYLVQQLTIDVSQKMTIQFPKPGLSPFASRTLESLSQLGDTQAAGRLTELCSDKLSLERVLSTAAASLLASNLQPLQTPGATSPTVSALVRLRMCRKWLMLALFYSDVSGKADVERVCSMMSEFAQWACKQALAAVSSEIIERFGIPIDENGTPQDLYIIAMGKAGANELNVSSDLDIVFLHRSNPYPLGETAKGFASSEVLEKIARQASKLLNESTEHGFVFRIDTRLRPFGESGPLICSLTMLENYLVTNGREWERLAWLKAKCIAHTEFANQREREQDLNTLTSLLTPFIYRRYLDFQAIDALRDLHAKIRIQANTKLRNNGYDVKLGRGGIREIEFIAQLFQVIRGGREPELRNPATVATLRQLALKKIITAEQIDLLIDAYWFWRRTEHMLQYREDQQTHLLEDSAHEHIAQMLNISAEEFQEKVKRYSTTVASIFDGVMGDRPQNQTQDQNTTDFNTAENEILGERIKTLKQSRRYRQATTSTVVLIDELLGAVLQSLSTTEATAELRLLALIESLIGRPGYLTLLLRFPEVRQRVVRLIGKATWAFDYLNTHPIVLDELLSNEWLSPVNYRMWAEQLSTKLNDNALQTDTERKLDILREAHHAQVFRLLAQDIEGLMTTETLSDHLSLLADYTVALTLDVAWQHIQASNSKRMLRREKPQFAVIAYGKLGGKELGYASDLDLVYLFDKTDDDEDQAEETYAVLAQRLSGFLSMRTSAGQLFDVDTRLRPNGDSGLISVSIEAFEKYQTGAAWTWEHQAISRARFVAGDAQLGAKFEAIRRKVLLAKPDAQALKNDVTQMRQKMLDGHPNKTDLFDIKHDRGAMVDIEFMVQYIVLGHAFECEAMLQNAGNIALLKVAAKANLIPENLANECANAYRKFRQRQHAIRLNDSTSGAAPCRVPVAEFTAERKSVLGLWDWLFHK
jgi:[glutamine synthetase] adenylyltransferase / [glutamine synthetase]-adenylyl-L-tyrosine phosphorylase